MSTKKNSGFYLQLFVALLAGGFIFSACTFSVTTNQDPTSTMVATTGDAASNPVDSSPVSTTDNLGTSVIYEPLSLLIPQQVATGASGKDFPRVDSEEAAWWQLSPGHLQVMLGDYYILQDKFHQPQIYVYPAQDYAELLPTVFENIHRLNNILSNTSAVINPDELPTVPFFNAKHIFASGIEVLSFQNGSGVRFVTQYAQYAAPVNNHELFYQFQGVTDDGAYYIIAIFPVTAPDLAENSDSAAVRPINGIAYPDMSDTNADWDAYYAAVTELLNTTPGDAFNPALGQLDALINSMEIATP